MLRAGRGGKIDYKAYEWEDSSTRRRGSKPDWLARGKLVALLVLLFLVARAGRSLIERKLDPAKGKLVLPLLVEDELEPVKNWAFVTGVFTDDYVPGALTLLHSLRQHRRAQVSYILLHIGTLSPRSLCLLRGAGWDTRRVQRIPPPKMGRRVGWKDQFTKLRAWELPFDVAIWVDADVILRSNIDELFDLPFPFAAVPTEFGERGVSPDINGGVFLLRPSAAAFSRLRSALPIQMYDTDWYEQGFLSSFFATSMARLPMAYNTLCASDYARLPAFQQQRREAKVLHLTGRKPWHLEKGEKRTECERDWERVEWARWKEAKELGTEEQCKTPKR